MSDLHSTIDNPVKNKKPKGKLETSDLDLREKTDNYNRKNAILWTVSTCSIVLIVAVSVLFIWNIFTNEHIKSLLLEKMVENIVVIATFICALFGIQAHVQKS